MSIASHGTALNVTVQSYNGRMDYGLIACRRAVPDITEIGDYMLAEHKLLMELTQKHPAAAGAAPAPVPPKTVAEPSDDEAEARPVAAATKKKPAARKKAPVKVAAKKAPVKAAAKVAAKAPAKTAAKKATPKPPARKAAPAKRSSSASPRAAVA